MADPRLRQLTIKTNVVKRLTKERTCYGKEVLLEQKRLEKFRAQNADEHVLNKQAEVIAECEMMLPDTIRRLKKEYEVLEKFLQDEIELKESKEYLAAEQVLAEAKELLQPSAGDKADFSTSAESLKSQAEAPAEAGGGDAMDVA